MTTNQEKELVEKFLEYQSEWEALDKKQNKWKPPFIKFISDMIILHKKGKLSENMLSYLQNYYDTTKNTGTDSL